MTMQFRLDKNRDAAKRSPVRKLLVLAAVVLAGIVGLRKARKPVYYWVEDGDAVCVLGECRKRNYDGVLDLNKMPQRDSNLVYPGRRCVPTRASLNQVVVSVLTATVHPSSIDVALSCCFHNSHVACLPAAEAWAFPMAALCRVQLKN